MRRKFLFVSLIVLLPIICLLGVGVPVWSEPPRQVPESVAAPATVLITDNPGLQMRAKLTRSKDILAGLIGRDFETVSRAARELKRLSEATNWKRQADAHYHELHRQFQRQCAQLDSLARNLNYEGTQFVYQNITMTCIRCHDHVRGHTSGGSTVGIPGIRLRPQ